VAQQTVAGPERSAYYEETRGSGWITFAAVVIIMVATLNIIDGIAAVSKSNFFVGNAHYVFSDLKTWGWILLVLGVLQLIAAYAVLGGSEAARWFGIAVAGINAIGQLAYVPAQPWWAITMFALDVVVIFGLAVYGGRNLRET
jgi:hypothetical protein